MKLQVNLAAKAALLAALLATGACDVLTQDPPAALSTNDAFATPARIAQSAAGMYDGLQNAEFYGGRVLIYGDVRSDDTDPSAYFSGISDFTALSSNGYALNAWTGGYQTIFSANLFMQNLAAHPGIVSQTLTDQYNGEAKFIRAICLFQLCNLYAQPYGFTADASHLGVPIQLTAADAGTAFSASQQLARSSVKDVYTQVEKDLLDAVQLLPASSTAASFNTVARATKNAAQAMLMRLYLYKGDNASALTRANNITGSGVTYSLNSTPVATFRPTYPSSESIFSVAMNSNDNPNTNNSLGQHWNVSGRADITINPYIASLGTLVAVDDKRRVSSVYSTTSTRTTLVETKSGAASTYYTAKYTSVADWVPVVRYPEVLLTKAETLVLTTNTVNADAITALNTVRERSRVSGAAYTAASFTSAADLLTAIRNERRIEFVAEGLRYYDLLRYKQGIPARGTAAAVPYGDNRLVFPIPLVETQSNPNLVQNPGY